MYYKLIPKGANLFSYIELSMVAKQIAKTELINSELSAIAKDIQKYKAQPLHKRISNKLRLNKIDTFIWQKNYLNKLKTNQNYLERCINENLCQFTVDGNYVTYCN